MAHLDKLKKAIRFIQKNDATLFLNSYYFQGDDLHKKIDSFYDYHSGESTILKSELMTEEMAEKIEWEPINRIVNVILIEQEEEVQKQKRLEVFYGE